MQTPAHSTTDKNKWLVGIDLGGTKLEGIVLNQQGTELKRQRAQTPRGNYPTLLDGVADFIRQFTRELEDDFSLGIGTPGSTGTDGLMRNSNTTEFNGQPFFSDLRQKLGIEFVMENDANCFALSESRDGAARDYRNVFGVIIGTGVGGGVIVDGKLISGHNRIGGEWGHNPLPWPGGEEYANGRYRREPCYCGRTGCIETFLSGPGLSQTFRQLTGLERTPEQIAALADQQDPAAEKTLQTYEDQLARSLASVINLLDPDCIVLGGGLSRLHRLYTEVPKRWNTCIFSNNKAQTRLLPPVHGDSSGVRGAAWLAS